MSEYIDREDTIKLLRSLGSRDYRREKGTIQDAIKMITYSEYTPNADVVMQSHGYWKDCVEFDDGFFVCTNCGFVSEAAAAPKLYKYCPNCGAKMDGAKTE